MSGLELLHQNTLKHDLYIWSPRPLRRIARQPSRRWVWAHPRGKVCGYPSLVPLSRRSHAARCRVWSFSTKIPKNTTYTSDHHDHLEELPGNHLVGGYGPPPGEGVGYPSLVPLSRRSHATRCRGLELLHQNTLKHDLYIWSPRPLRRIARQPSRRWVWPTPGGRCGYPSLVPLSRRSHAARCRVWSFSTKIPKNTTYTSDHHDT